MKRVTHPHLPQIMFVVKILNSEDALCYADDSYSNPYNRTFHTDNCKSLK